VPKAALARPLPTRQTRQKGRLNFLYPECLPSVLWFRLPMGSYVNQYELLAHLLRAQSRIPDVLAVAVDGRPLQRKMPGGA
ncbi:hypothetical protein, partial [Pseudomonas aeruginosa]|uniref:hypothetical protein n=1 Tax=Pseudomonas aeruginosa TaxID=287 RepID=UPI001C108C15